MPDYGLVYPMCAMYAVWLYYRFKSMGQAQRFLGIHAAVYNLFNLGYSPYGRDRRPPLR